MIDSGMKDFRGRFPTTVKVASSEGAPIIAVDDAIRVEHWNDLENEIFSEEPRFVVVRIR